MGENRRSRGRKAQNCNRKMKYKGVEILPKPWWTFLYMRRADAFTTLDKIYLSQEKYKELLKNNLSVDLEATLEHEITHIKRFRKVGIWKSEIIYWLDKEFRYNEELAAIENQMRILKKNNRKYHFDKVSKYLSSFGYLWCTDYKTAKEDLKKIWNKT